MTKPTSMTELEAVNVLLTTIGEQPINSLSGNQTTDVSIARQVLQKSVEKYNLKAGILILNLM